jgi:hypothetical protein
MWRRLVADGELAAVACAGGQGGMSTLGSGAGTR